MSCFCSASVFQYPWETIPTEGFNSIATYWIIPQTLTQKKKSEYICVCIFIYIKWITWTYVNIILSLSPDIYIYIKIYIHGHAGTQKHGHASRELTIWFGCWCFLTGNKAVQLGPKFFKSSQIPNPSQILHQSNLFNLFLWYGSFQKLWSC